MSPNNTSSINDYKSASPGVIPKKGWKQILLRLKDRIGEDNVSIVSAGVAFYFFLSLFPAISAIVSIYGLVVEPAEVEQQLQQAAEVLPTEAHKIISGILTQTAGKSSESLSWSLILSLLFSLWSANKATTALFVGVNIAYYESDDRNFFRKTGITLLFTLGAIITGIIAVATVIAFPALIDKLGLPSLLQKLLAMLRWIVLAGIVYFAFIMLYKIAPSRATPEIKWVKTGAIFATVLWMAGSLLFTFYINNLGAYDKTYGSIAAVIILMLWFFLTGFIILLGAELNSEIEHQTSADTTIGVVKPMEETRSIFCRSCDRGKQKQGKSK